MNTLKFNDADLKVNREGRLSDAQAKRFAVEVDQLQGQRKEAFWYGVTVISVVVIGLMIVVFLTVGRVITAYTARTSMESLTRLASDVSSIIVVVIVVFFAVLLMLIIFLLDYGLRIRSLRSAPVRTVEGVVEIVQPDPSLQGESTSPSLYTNAHDQGYRRPLLSSSELSVYKVILHRTRYSSLTFGFDEMEALRYFKNGARYRVYYLPYAEPQLLSAEEIQTEKAKR